MKKRRYLARTLLLGVCSLVHAQQSQKKDLALQQCVQYTSSGDLIKASSFASHFTVSINRNSGVPVELEEKFPHAISNPMPATDVIPCRLVSSSDSKHGALGIVTDAGMLVYLLDLSQGQIQHSVQVSGKFPIQFSIHPIGYLGTTDQLAVSQAHYLPTGEPEIATQIIRTDGSIGEPKELVHGPQYSEVQEASFDFRNERVWFLCPVYSERIDRQPHCMLTSAGLLKSAVQEPTIPPPPDDRVIGSGQPSLGFPSSDTAVLLANRRLWLYRFDDQTFRQLNIPETPHHIRWFEFPGAPKFSSNGRFAVVPVYMSHNPLFEEGMVRHGVKLLVVDLSKLEIVQTIQPPANSGLVDFALRFDGSTVMVWTSWGKDWQSFQIPLKA